MEYIDDRPSHGTTILALKYENGVIVAADRRCTAGNNTILSNDSLKIQDTGSRSCVAGAGVTSHFQIVTEVFKNRIIPKYEDFWETEIFVDGQANLLKNLMRLRPFLVILILAGWDPYANRGRIFLFSPDGAIFEMKDYAASGSGERDAKAVLTNRWTKKCSREQGVQIAVEALLNASENDPFTADPAKNAPIVKIISPSKITAISPDEIFARAKTRQRARKRKAR